MKDYIIRVDHDNHKKEITKACEQICKDFDGEFLINSKIGKDYKSGHLKLTPKHEYTGIYKIR